MNGIMKILVPIDVSIHSHNAAKIAIVMAKKYEVEIDFLYVASDIHKDIPSSIIWSSIDDLISSEIIHYKHFERSNIPTQILGFAKINKSDLIIMGSRGLGIIEGAILGSVSKRIVEEATVPVMIVQ